MKVRAAAKLNLHLSVLAREADGFHQLETVFCALELADDLDVELGEPGVRLVVDGPDLGPLDRNLVHRAAVAYFEAAGLPAAVDVRLVKRVPAGAGLGGGSSDAAATLRALDQLHGAALGAERLLQLAARLGSDVPFFLADAALALAWGRGERLLALPEPPRAPVLLAVPPFAVSTPEAFRALDEHRAAAWVPEPRVHRAATFQTWTALAARATNDFEPVLFQRYPVLPALKAALLDAGAELALLTGSGSALFGIFRARAHCREAAQALRAAFADVEFIETTTATVTREDLLG
ncbi:MAG TPA: 4-(cytidine 5'-diphospho)-2-C-methyl-D-erythritol kinase [Longimicrobiales bacterium]|nr:4-(cytidine 5'-diphospho)-2-C-methyl-D-erythritol kinase [Longimicrobiales bacterium]